MEAVLSDESDTKDHARAARDARNKQERLKVSVVMFPTIKRLLKRCLQLCLLFTLSSGVS